MKYKTTYNRAPNRCKALNEDEKQCRGRTWGTICGAHTRIAKTGVGLWTIDDLAVVLPLRRYSEAAQNDRSRLARVREAVDSPPLNGRSSENVRKTVTDE